MIIYTVAGHDTIISEGYLNGQFFWYHNVPYTGGQYSMQVTNNHAGSIQCQMYLNDKGGGPGSGPNSRKDPGSVRCYINRGGPA